MKRVFLSVIIIFLSSLILNSFPLEEVGFDGPNDDMKDTTYVHSVRVNPNGNRIYTINGVVFEMVAVRGGTFTMGSVSEKEADAFDDERPSHSVTLKDYYIGKFEVTQELWLTVMDTNQSYFKGDKLPMESVSWYEAQEFIQKLNKITGENFRLPTEAEWEYAAKGGNKSRGFKFSGANMIEAIGWYTANSGKKTHPVGKKAPNELGIYDMSGNVWEWCSDYFGDYTEERQINPTGPETGRTRVARGGGWLISSRACRVTMRCSYNPVRSYNDSGFRLAL